MSFSYNNERPRCTCPRCRFAEANSQTKRNIRQTISGQTQDGEFILPQTQHSETEKAVEPVLPLNTKRDTSFELDSSCVELNEKASDTTQAYSESLSHTPADGSMESFEGNIPKGWGSDTPELISSESRRGHVHTGNYSVNMKNSAQLSYAVDEVDNIGHVLSFFAQGTGRRTGLTVKLYCITASDETECASIIIRKGDLPHAKGQFGYYILRIPSVSEGTAAIRAEFLSYSSFGQRVLLDDVKLN